MGAVYWVTRTEGRAFRFWFKIYFMKKLIIIFGNMGSGKSTLCAALAAVLPDFTSLGMDDYRRSVRDEHPDRNAFWIEREAEKQCAEALSENADMIWETTGASRFFLREWRRLRTHREVVMIRLECALDTCRNRVYARGENGIRLPFAKELNQTLGHIDDANSVLPADLVLDSEALPPEALAKAVEGLLKARKIKQSLQY